MSEEGGSMVVLAAAVILSCSGAIYHDKERTPLEQMSMVVDFQAGTLEMLNYKMRARTVSDTAGTVGCAPGCAAWVSVNRVSGDVLVFKNQDFSPCG